MMNTWVKKKGFPVITVKKKGNELFLTQERFFVSKNEREKYKNDE